MENEPNRYTLLECLVKVAPIIQQIVPFDCMIGVTDKHKFLQYLPAESINLADFIGEVVGTNVPTEDPIMQAVNTGHTRSSTVPKEAFGVPFKATGAPVRDEHNNIVGGIGLGVSLKNQEMLTDMVQSFASSTEEIVATTQELSASAQDLANEMDILNKLQAQMTEEVGKTGSMLNLINKIAANSNLLGLNASIEAARVGEQGKGFEVVANEIRKMADKSAESVKEVNEIIESIMKKVEHINNTTSKVSDISQHQAAASQQISASMQELATAVEKIEQIAKII